MSLVHFSKLPPIVGKYLHHVKSGTALALSNRMVKNTNPAGKVLSLLVSLAAKIIKEGEAEEKAFQEYSDWCTETTRNRL